MSIAKKISLSIALFALVYTLGDMFARKVTFTHPDNLVMGLIPVAINIMFVFALVFVWAYGRGTD